MTRYEAHIARKLESSRLSELLVASANVGTLDPREARQLRQVGQRGTTRALFLADFFHKQHYQLVGLQETRLTDEGVTTLPHYTVYSSPGRTDGTGGVQLWAHDDVKSSLGAVGCHPAGARLLRLECSRGPLSFTALVGHAPVSASPTADKVAFWTQRRQAATAALHPQQLLCFIDANDDDAAKGPDSNHSFATEFREAFRLLDAASHAGQEAPTWFGSSASPHATTTCG